MGINYDNDSVRRMRYKKALRPVIDSFEDRIIWDSESEERKYKYLELFPRDFIIIKKKQVI